MIKECGDGTRFQLILGFTSEHLMLKEKLGMKIPVSDQR